MRADTALQLRQTSASPRDSPVTERHVSPESMELMEPMEATGPTEPPKERAHGSRRVLSVGSGPFKALPAMYAGFELVRLDLDPAVEPDLLLDGRELATQEPAQFDAVFCSHNLEHYRRHEVPQVLAGFLHVLRPGGLAQIIVPDLQALMQVCITQNLDLEDLLYMAPIGPVRPLDVLFGHAATIEQTGDDFYAHRTGFSRRSLAGLVAAAGFGPMFVRQDNLELNVVAFAGEPDPDLAALFELPLTQTPSTVS